MADKAAQFCNRWYAGFQNPSLLVLVGESGCGKTHTAKKVFNFACATWGAGSFSYPWFFSWPEVVDQFKANDYSAVETAKECGLLVIDDIGAEYDPSKNAADKLCQILSKREKRFTVITTNIKIEQWPERFNTRIADRLMRNSEIVNLFGVESYSVL